MIYSFEHRTEAISASHPKSRTIEYPLLIHRQLEVIYIVKGHATCVIDGKDHSLSARDICVVFPYVPHSYNFVECEYIMLFFQPEICLDYESYIKGHKPVQPIVSGCDKNGLGALAVQAFDAYSQGNEFGNKISKGYINALLGELLSRLPTEKYTVDDHNTLSDILIYCSENFKNSDISIASLSKAVGISPKHCSYLINSMMNTDFRQYVNSLRMFEAARLIANTDQAITRIMLDVGYENQSTFNRVFKEQYGMTPKEYRLSKRQKI